MGTINNQTMKLKEFLTLLTGLAVAGATAQAQYTPVPLTPESFTFDIVVERDAAKPPARDLSKF